MGFLSKTGSLFSLLKQAIRGDNQNYTEGSIDRAIVLLAVPMVLEMAMESLFAVVDVYFVSRLNDNDVVATVGLTESVITLVYSIAFGVSMGATAMVARRIGEKNYQAASQSAMQAIYIGIGLSVIISVSGVFFAKDILHLLGASDALIDKGVNYTRWMFGGNITIMMLFIINATFRGAGDASLAMRTLWLSNGLNIVLDPIFILGLGSFNGFGVEGAAIATNIGRGAGVLFQVYHLMRGNDLIKIRPESLPFRWDVVVRLIRLSLGGTGQFMIASASWIFLMRIISTFGSTALAGYTIAIRVIIFTILPAWGMANAAATLVGQNLGNGRPDRAEKSVWRSAFFNMIFLGTISIFFLFLARPIVMIFTSDVQVIEYGTQCLRIVCLGYVFFAYGMVIGQSFNGAGDTRTPTVLNLFGFWILQIPLAYLFAIILGFGPTGVYVAIALAESVLAVVSVLVFRRGAWKAVKI